MISTARHCIYVSGPGFNASASGQTQAATYAAALRSALGRGIPVVRVQTTPVVTDFWLDHLTTLVAQFPRLFELWVFMEPPTLPLAGMCAIDVDDATRNISEFMIQIPRHLGAQQHDIASTAVFVEGHPTLARAVRDRILEFASDSDRARRVATAQAMDGFFRGEYLLTYDSYMDVTQTSTRFPSAIRIGPVVLHDHRLVFNRTGSYRPGGVANVEPATDSRVYGVLWRMSPSDLQAMDAAQDPRAYRRRPLTTWSLTGKRFDACHVYSAPADRVGDEPDVDHLEVMIAAARDAGLPTEYVAELECRRRAAPRGDPRASPPIRHPARRDR